MGTKFINAVNDSHGLKKAQKNLIHRVRMQRAQHPYLIHSFSPSTNISKLILELTSHWKFHWAGQWWHICCNCCHLPLWNLPRAGTAKGPSGYLPQPQNPSWDIAASIAVHSSFAGFTGGLVPRPFSILNQMPASCHFLPLDFRNNTRVTTPFCCTPCLPDFKDYFCNFVPCVEIQLLWSPL